MNIRETIRQQLGDEGVAEYDRSQQLQEELREKLCDLIDGEIEAASGSDGTTSAMMVVGALEAVSAAYAGTVVSAFETLTEAGIENDGGQARFIATAIKSVVGNLKVAFEEIAIEQNDIAGQIKAAAAAAAAARKGVAP